MKLYQIAQLMEATDGTRGLSSLNMQKGARKGQKSDIFRKTNWDSADIQLALSKLQQAGINPTELKQACQPYIQQLEQQYNAAPVLTQARYNNRVESAIFEQLWTKTNPSELAEKIGAPIFNPSTMNRLLQKMNAANPEFFPLKSTVEERALGYPVVEYAEYDYPDDPVLGPTSNTTACATPGGKFIFNVGFLQSLLNYAHLIELKPTASFLNETGRRAIPKEYGYIEMLLAHEFLHYTRSDFHKQHKIPKDIYDHRVDNIATDLRSNYKLIQSGYSQIPIGFFSDELNGDRFYDYIKLYKAVKAELDKMPKQQQDQMSQQGQDNHKPGQEEASDSKEKQKADKRTEQQMNEADQKADEKMADDKQQDSEKTASSDKPSNEKSDKPGNQGGQLRQVTDTNEQVKPKKTWQQIVNAFIKSGMPEQQQTWAKQRRSNVTLMPMVDQHDAGAMKPGFRNIESDDSKLVLCIDSSGSMGSAIGAIMKSLTTLLNQHFPNSVFYILKFSGVNELYRCKYSDNSAEKINSITDTKGTKGKLSDLLSSTLDGGTEFNQQTFSYLNSILAKQYNLLMVTDTDILGEDNFSTLVKLAHTYSNLLNIVLRNGNDYREFINTAVGLDLNNVTHF